MTTQQQGLAQQQSGQKNGQKNETPPGTEPRFHPFRLGGIDFISVSDGGILAPAGGPPPEPGKGSGDAPASGAAPAAGAAPIPQEAAEVTLVPLSCLLVRPPQTGKWVLMDSGFGLDPIVPFPMPTVGRLLQSLSLAKISPSEIDAVLISHLDPDHVGGLFDADGKPTFPNATYHAGTEDVQYWSQKDPDLTFSPIVEWGKKDRVSAARRLFKFAGGSLKTCRAGEEMVPGVRTILLPGHTLGQIGFIIGGEGVTLLYTGDGMTSVEKSVMAPDEFNPNDLVPQMAVETRHMLIEMLLRPGWYNFSPHFPWPNAGSLQREGDKQGWKPVD